MKPRNFIIVLRCVLCVAFAGAISSCGNMLKPSPERLSEDVGPLPENYQELVSGNIISSMVDPESARLDFVGRPTRGYVSRFGGQSYVGWTGIVNVNGKNRMGGYVGARPYNYCIRYGSVVAAFETAASQWERSGR